MSITSQLGAPPRSTRKKGRFTLNRIFAVEGVSAVPVVPTNMTNIVQVNWGQPAWDDEGDVFQQAGGNKKSHEKVGPRWDGVITVLSGSIGEVISKIQGLTWGTGSGEYAAIRTRQDRDNPQVHWEAVCRGKDNKTHLFSAIVPDMIVDDIGWDNPMEYADNQLNFHTYTEPFFLKAGCEMVYDTYDATSIGATLTDYALSATPVSLASPTLADEWYFEKLINAKEKLSGAGTGIEIVDNITITNATASITPGTPTVGSQIQILHAKQT